MAEPVEGSASICSLTVRLPRMATGRWVSIAFSIVLRTLAEVLVHSAAAEAFLSRSRRLLLSNRAQFAHDQILFRKSILPVLQGPQFINTKALQVI